MYDAIINNLRSSERARQKDQKYFKDYENGDIDLQTCKHYFKINNCIPEREFAKISDEMFMRWLGSLGWTTDLSKMN